MKHQLEDCQQESFSQLAVRCGLPPVVKADSLLGGGSGKRFFRLWLAQRTPSPQSVVGVLAESVEQVDQLKASEQFFASRGLPVARCLATSTSPPCYLLEDLSDWTLSQRIQQWKINQAEQILPALIKVVTWLSRFQCYGTEGLEQLPIKSSLDQRIIEKDWQNFIQYFVKEQNPSKLPMPDQAQAELKKFFAEIVALGCHWFCYRDFHCRNVMWQASDAKGEPTFIDYQDGMRGPLSYDLVSLLYSPDTGINAFQRTKLTSSYLVALNQVGISVPTDFQRQITLLTWQRRTQALGAYGRIAKQGKPAFLKKIPVATRELCQLLENNQFPAEWSYLKTWLWQVLAG